jgi:hypothetical protein
MLSWGVQELVKARLHRRYYAPNTMKARAQAEGFMYKYTAIFRGKKRFISSGLLSRIMIWSFFSCFSLGGPEWFSG